MNYKYIELREQIGDSMHLSINQYI